MPASDCQHVQNPHPPWSGGSDFANPLVVDHHAGITSQDVPSSHHHFCLSDGWETRFVAPHGSPFFNICHRKHGSGIWMVFPSSLLLSRPPHQIVLVCSGMQSPSQPSPRACHAEHQTDPVKCLQPSLQEDHREDPGEEQRGAYGRTVRTDPTWVVLRWSSHGKTVWSTPLLDRGLSQIAFW